MAASGSPSVLLKTFLPLPFFNISFFFCDLFKCNFSVVDKMQDETQLMLLLLICIIITNNATPSMIEYLYINKI